jgi:RNA polymerase sigma-70 factor (ECF subfamily)
MGGPPFPFPRVPPRLPRFFCALSTGSAHLYDGADRHRDLQVDRTLERIVEEHIVESARGGDAEAFGMLYERYYAAMVWLAYSILLDRDRADDAAQQTFVKTCERLADLRRADRFGPWLAAICRNEAHQLLRQRERRIPRGVCDEEYASMCDRRDDNRDLVRLAVDRLAPMYREIVVLHYFNGMDYSQIASTLGIAEHTVRGRLCRARKRIEQTLRRNGYPER